MKNKVLVVGGAGFIGSHVVDQLIDTGNEVAIIDDLSSGKKENLNTAAKFYQGDIKNKDFLEQVFKNEHPSTVVHLAAQKSVTKSVADPIHDAQENIIGSLTLFETMRNHDIKRIVFSSTGGALYGETTIIPTPEDHEVLPDSPYGIAKLSIEHYLRFYAKTYAFQPFILRFANVYGPRQDPAGEAGVVAIFCGKVLANEPLTIFGDGNQTRDYVYVKDVARAALLALDSKESATTNIGTAYETSVNQLVEKLKKISGKAVTVNYQPGRPGELSRSCIDNSQAKKLLAWTPDTTLDQGITETYQYFSLLHG